MDQVGKYSQNYPNTEQQFICPLQIINLLKKLQTIDENKRITHISKKGQRNKVIIGRRNAITRISMRVQKEIQSFQISRNIREQTIKQSSIVPDFTIIQKFFQQKFQRRLLYRATQNNFSVEAFHQLCDGYPNTLVLCKTQSSNIIGGFTPLTWDCQYDANQTYFKTDNKNLTFLFSITEEQKYSIKKSQRNKAICCYEKYGPTFGGGYDLCIADNAALEASSFSYFPRNFQCPQQISQQVRNERFTGCSKDYFKLKEWQVFQLKFKQRKTTEQVRRIKIVKMQNNKRTETKSKSKFNELKSIFKKLFRFKNA